MGGVRIVPDLTVAEIEPGSSAVLILSGDHRRGDGGNGPFAGGGDRYRDEPAVTDRGLTTAGAADPIDFARHIFAELGLYTSDVLDACYRLYHDGDASAFAVLAAA